MRWIIAMLCAMDFHKWSPWQKVSCGKERKCLRCLRVKRMIRHTFGEVGYVEEGSCQTQVRCTECGATESRNVLHILGDLSGRTRTCTRCGVKVEVSFSEFLANNPHLKACPNPECHEGTVQIEWDGSYCPWTCYFCDGKGYIVDPSKQ